MLTASLSGQVIIQPTAVSAEGQTVDFRADAFDLTIDGSGLPEPLTTGSAIPETFSLHEVPGGLQIFPLTAARFNMGTVSQDAILTYDLGDLYSIETLIFYNYAEVYQGQYYNDRGLASAEILTSADGETFTSAGNFEFTQAPDEVDITPQVLPLGATGVRYVRFAAMTSHGGNRTGWSEVRFTGVPGAVAPSEGVKIVDTEYLSDDESPIFRLTVASRAGFVYQLQRSPDLATPFEDIDSPIVGNDAELVVEDSTPPAGKAFYQVVETRQE